MELKKSVILRGKSVQRVLITFPGNNIKLVLCFGHISMKLYNFLTIKIKTLNMLASKERSFVD